MSEMAGVGGIQITAPADQRYDSILTPEALGFVAALCRRHQAQLQALLAARAERQAAFDAGALPDFLPETRAIRDGDWTVAPIPADLQDRRVEITSPVDRKLIINALNSGAQGYMADFEDSATPSWRVMMAGQVNLRDAVAGTITYAHPESGEHYALNTQTAVLHVRPRGLHMVEPNIQVDGQPAAAALVDFGLFLFHNAARLAEQGSGAYFYLPKLQSHHEAHWWRDVFEHAQAALGLQRGAIKATVLIETLPAAFEMDEILHALRDYAVGLNCSRWGYIFSTIKTLRAHDDRVLPDRQALGMDQHFLDSLSRLLCHTCHKRGALAIGGMANWVPVNNDPAANEKALDKVRADKRREIDIGYDGTWVAHPALVPVVAEVCAGSGAAKAADGAATCAVTTDDLLGRPTGEITEAGLRNNIGVCVQYIEAWLGGQGAVALYNLMEDAATAEICRVQVWQWLHHPGAALADGRAVTRELFESVLAEELDIIQAEVGHERFASGRFDAAGKLMHGLCTGDDCADFLTSAASEWLLRAQER
ncbi:malate synthase A [bacterium]|nr:malate synthase A [bacterium]